MCGIFGAIGRGFDPQVVISLAIANQARGKDSLGFVCDAVDGPRIWKKKGEPLALLARAELAKYRRCWDSAWYALGHTRAATRGKVSTQNAHPFASGTFLGIHNGIVDAPAEFEVDSQYLWHLLALSDGDYQAAWGELGGFWGLAWTDGAAVYLQAHQQELAMARRRDLVYFSSDPKHLDAAIGSQEVTELSEGETWRFEADGSTMRLPDLVNREPRFYSPDLLRDCWWRYGDDERETGCQRESRLTDADQAELDALRDQFYLEGELSDRDWDRLAELEQRESWDYWSDGAADVGLSVMR